MASFVAVTSVAWIEGTRAGPHGAIGLENRLRHMSAR
jgi:hypothetical protein